MASSESFTPPNPKKLQEEEVVWSEECKQLLLTLPKQQGWGHWPYLFHYQGFWYTSRQLQGTLTCRSRFQSHPSDVLLVSFPKSGTTWLKSLLFSIINRRIHPVNDLSNHPLTTNNPHDLVPFIERNLYVQDNLPSTPNDHYPPSTSIRLMSTHMPITCLPTSIIDSGCKIVYLCRDPRDTFVSLWHFINMGGSANLDEVFDKFCDGVSVYGPFWDHVLGYWKESVRRPCHVLFLKFEDLKVDPKSGVKRLAESLGCPFSFEEDEDGVVDGIVGMCSFRHLSSLDVNMNGRQNARWTNKAFFRRGEVGDWANYLTPKMSDRLVKIVEDKLHGVGLINN